MEAYHRQAMEHYNKHAKPPFLRARDLVLRKMLENMKKPRSRKFQANWEGPYKVYEVGQGGAYYLEKLNLKCIPRP